MALRQNLPSHGAVQGALVCVLAVGATLLVLHSVYARISTTDRSSSQDYLLTDLPLPHHGSHLDWAQRYRLLFGSFSPSSGTLGGTEPSTSDELRRAALERDPQKAEEDALRSRGSGRNASRLVVLPDLHGDAQQALRALLLAGLVTLSDRSNGGSGQEGGQATATAAAAAAESRTAGPATAPGRHLRSAFEASGVDGHSRQEKQQQQHPPASWTWEWRWVGGDAVLVQLGDVVDRGPDSLALLGLLERLRAQAQAAGGDVVALLGNHELMNVHHDFRYISRSELRTLAIIGGPPRLWPGASSADEGLPVEGAASHKGRAAAGFGDDNRREAAETGEAAGRPGGSERQRQQQQQQQQQQRQAPEDQRGMGREEEEAQKKEQLSLLAEARPEGGARPGSERELLSTAGAASGTPFPDSDGVPWPGGQRMLQAAAAAAEGSGGTGASQRYLEQHQQMLRGLEIWQAALAPDQPLGRLVRRRPLAAIVDGGGCRVLAVHAGAFPWMLSAVERLLVGAGGAGDSAEGGGSSGGSLRLEPEHYVAAWNAAVTAALRNCQGRRCGGGAEGGTEVDADAGWPPAYSVARERLAELLLGGDGAVWSRRYEDGPPKQVCAEVAEVTRRLGVQRLVVGHTVQRGGRVSSRCGGHLVMADVGLSRAIAGEMAVLQCTGGEMSVMYGDGRTERLTLL